MSILTKKLFSIPQLIMVDVLILLIALAGWWGYDKYQSKYVSQVDLVNQAQEAIKNYDYQKAADYYEKASQKGELDKESLFNYGIANYNLENYEKAAESYETITTNDDQDYKALNNLGNVYRDMGDYNLAEEYYLKALGLQPDYINIYINLNGLYSYKDGQEDKAIELLNKGLEKITQTNDKVTIYYMMIALYDQKGKEDQVKQAYEKILELDSNNEDAKNFLGK